MGVNERTLRKNGKRTRISKACFAWETSRQPRSLLVGHASRRTTLTFSRCSPATPQKKRSRASDSRPETPVPGGISMPLKYVTRLGIDTAEIALAVSLVPCKSCRPPVSRVTNRSQSSRAQYDLLISGLHLMDSAAVYAGRPRASTPPRPSPDLFAISGPLEWWGSPHQSWDSILEDHGIPPTEQVAGRSKRSCLGGYVESS